MTVLVFGGHGMAGHIVSAYLRTRPNRDVWYTSRHFDGDPQCLVVDVMNAEQVVTAIVRARPDVVVNAVGLLNDDAEQHVERAVAVNALFPRHLARLGRRHSFRLIHVSTDCVFSGRQGPYSETDPTDGYSVYAKTKSLGEVLDAPHVTTLRTSIIGPELKADGIGLFHWTMLQRGTIYGFQSVMWNGVTTLELARAIDWLLDHPLKGLIQLANSEPISKHALLVAICRVFNKSDVTIIPRLEPVSNKTLVNTRPDFSYTVPSYGDMLSDLKQWMDMHPREEYLYG